MAPPGKTVLATVVAGALIALVATTASAASSFIGRLSALTEVASTVPTPPNSQDQNPYGVAVVPVSRGQLVRGDVLVSNFNNAANQQGTGTTIVQISPSGSVSLFAQIDATKLPGACPGGVGLTTALSVLRSGWVIVGSLPTADGTSATMQAGCLIVLNSQGQVVRTISGGPINGPWDMTAVDFGAFAELFVTNVLNGLDPKGPSTNVVDQGTVVRIGLLTLGTKTPVVFSETVIGKGFPERTDPAALVVGPTGVGFDGNTLYVADTNDSSIVAIHGALGRQAATTGQTISSTGSLNGPLGLAIAPNADILTTNGGDGLLVETTPGGQQVATFNTSNVDSSFGAGSLFGLAVKPGGSGVYLVDDGNNTFWLLH